MTLAEYRAWLSGYVSSFKGGVPDASQWDEVARKLATVKESSIPFAPYGPRLPDSMTIPWVPYVTC